LPGLECRADYSCQLPKENGENCSGDGECASRHCECGDASCSNSAKKCAATACAVCKYTTTGLSCDGDLTSGTNCDDGEACTYADQCGSAGTCTGTPVVCTSGTPPCGIVSTCNGTASCTNVYPGVSTACDDGSACTYGDHCNASGSCVAGSVTGLAPTGQVGSATVDLTWNEIASVAQYFVRLSDGTAARYDDPRYATCGANLYYYCEDYIPAASICASGICTITSVPVINGRAYSYWVQGCVPACGNGCIVGNPTLGAAGSTAFSVAP
jgi:hypothetical protein